MFEQQQQQQLVEAKVSSINTDLVTFETVRNYGLLLARWISQLILENSSLNRQFRIRKVVIKTAIRLQNWRHWVPKSRSS